MADGIRQGKGLVRGFSEFLRDTAGNITMIFALASIPMLLAVGAAIDTARINREDASFRTAVDTSCLAIASDDRSATTNDTISAANQTALEQLAAKYINSNYSPTAEFSGSVTVSVKVTNSEITTDAELEFPTSIMSLAGINSMTLKGHCKVAKAMKPIEVAMVMDTTGSMGSNNKLTNAKSAARQFLTTVYGGTLASKPRSEYVRVAFVPFSASVRLDLSGSDFDINWVDTTGLNPLSTMNFRDKTTNTNVENSTGLAWNNYMAWNQFKISASSNTRLQWSGCMEARSYSTTAGEDFNINDVAPSASDGRTLFPAYFSPDTYTLHTTTGTAAWSDGDYIGNTNLYQEWYDYSTSSNNIPTTGGTTAVNTANMKKRQENLKKYVTNVVGAEYSKTYGPWYNCVKTPIVPMTYDRQAIETAITNMTAYGNTLLPEGLAWGYRALSPTQPLTKVAGSGTIPATSIAPFDGPRWQKIMIFMTDGENDVAGLGNVSPSSYNGTAYSAFGFGNQSPLASNRYGVLATSPSAGKTNLDTMTSKICTTIKNAKISLYVVGLEVPSASVGLLKACATQPNAPYYQDGTSANITTLFDHIGQDVLNKMVYIKE